MIDLRTSMLTDPSAHRIRLHGPWWFKATEETVESESDLAAAGFIKNPLPFLLSDPSGASQVSSALLTILPSPTSSSNELAVWTGVRPFRMPTGIAESQRVWLEITEPVGITSVMLAAGPSLTCLVNQDLIADSNSRCLAIDVTERLSGSGSMRLILRGTLSGAATTSLSWPFQTLALVIGDAERV